MFTNEQRDDQTSGDRLRSIGTREIISFSENGIRLWGTYHPVQDARRDLSPDANEGERIGVLFLNSGFHPRAANGAVYWADLFARCGYPSFRLDLPGLGDSHGNLTGDVADFLQLVNGGGYAAVLAQTTQSLMRRCNLSGLVLVGHCAGAVSAIFAAAATNDVKGLILLNPYFHREEPESTGLRTEFRRWIPRSRMAAYLSKLYDRLKYLRRLLRTNDLPKNANPSLVRCFRNLASSGLPMLVLKARDLNPRVGDFDYIQHVQRISRRKQRIEVQRIEGTNHAFVKGPGKEAVGSHAEQWLRAHFPVKTWKDSAASGAPDSSKLRMMERSSDAGECASVSSQCAD